VARCHLSTLGGDPLQRLEGPDSSGLTEAKCRMPANSPSNPEHPGRRRHFFSVLWTEPLFFYSKHTGLLKSIGSPGD